MAVSWSFHHPSPRKLFCFSFGSILKVPQRIKPLIEDGLVDKVLGSLMSGKEAQVFLVRCGEETRCAKVYKDVAKRSFKNAVQYQEGRKIRNSRRQRAIDKRSKFGRDQQEDVWQRAEVDALYKLAEAGVRVPKAYGFFRRRASDGIDHRRRRRRRTAI